MNAGWCIDLPVVNTGSFSHQDKGSCWVKREGGGCSRAGRVAPEATESPLSWARTDQIWAHGHGQERTVCTLCQQDPGYISIVTVIMCLFEQKATGGGDVPAAHEHPMDLGSQEYWSPAKRGCHLKYSCCQGPYSHLY